MERLILDDFDPMIADLGDFDEKSINSIKKEQKRIFDSKVDMLLEELCHDFISRHSRAELKAFLVKSTIHAINQLLFIPFNTKIHFEMLDLTFEKEDHRRIQKYFKDTILKGKEVDLSFIHPENSIYEIRNKRYHEVYAIAFWKFNLWLEEEFLPIIEEDNCDPLEELNLTDSHSGKVILLELLGVIDYLRSYPALGASTNKLSQIISDLTGTKATTIQSYLNPIVSKSADQKNNPLLNAKKVRAIRHKLEDLGIEQKIDS